jgi:hypothetical protein
MSQQFVGDAGSGFGSENNSVNQVYGDVKDILNGGFEGGRSVSKRGSVTDDPNFDINADPS